jgi:hypothetical protein
MISITTLIGIPTMPYLGKVVRNHVPNSPTLITDSVLDLHYKVLFDLGRR